MDQGFVYFNNDWVVDFQESDKEVIKNDLIIRVSEAVAASSSSKNSNFYKYEERKILD